MVEDCDMDLLAVSLNDFRVLFGVNDTSMEFVAKDSQVPVEQLKIMIKSSCLLETKSGETLEEKIFKCADRFASASVRFLARGHSIGKVVLL